MTTIKICHCELSGTPQILMDGQCCEVCTIENQMDFSPENVLKLFQWIDQELAKRQPDVTERRAKEEADQITKAMVDNYTGGDVKVAEMKVVGNGQVTTVYYPEPIGKPLTEEQRAQIVALAIHKRNQQNEELGPNAHKWLLQPVHYWIHQALADHGLVTTEKDIQAMRLSMLADLTGAPDL